MLTSIPLILFPPSPPFLTTNIPGFPTGLAIDAAGEKFAVVFPVPKTGTIDRIRFATTTVPTSEDLSVSIQTVSATDGFPTGTLYGGSASETVTAPAASTIYTVTFATPATATKGDVIAVVIEFASAVGNVLIARTTSGISPAPAYVAHYTTSWGKSGVSPLFSLIYNDNTSEYIGCPPAAIIAGIRSHSNTVIPDEVGLRFKMPFGARAIGVFGWLAPVAGRQNTLILYSDDGTLLASISPDFDQTNNVTTNIFSRFSTPFTLTKDTWYRLTYRPDTASPVNIPFFSFTDSLELGQFSGPDIYHCERTDAGSFIDNTGAFTPISLMLDQIDLQYTGDFFSPMG